MNKLLSILAGGLLTFSVANATTIYEIQHTTNPNGVSPLVDTQVADVEGIVTATHGDKFYMSEEGGGAWKGIYVFDWTIKPNVGDKIKLSGTVAEYYENTQITTITDFTVLSTGNEVPAPSVITASELKTEAYEGVLVKIEDVTVSVATGEHNVWRATDATGEEFKLDDKMYMHEATVGQQFDYVIGMNDYSYDEYTLNPRSISDLGIGGEAVSATVAEIKANPENYTKVIINNAIVTVGVNSIQTGKTGR